MGILVQMSSGERVSLRARHMVGRSRRCDLRIRDASVSGEHATLFWHEDAWRLRDLGSRNGSYADSVEVPPGEVRVLTPGTQLAFGDVADWVLEDARGPEARAIALDGGADATAVAGVLALPSGEDPQLVLSARDDGSWVAQAEDADRIVVDLDEIGVGGRKFRLHLPIALESTAVGEARILRIPDVELRFFVSRDEETVEFEIANASAVHRFSSRSQNYALLTLARIWQQESALPDGERGWVEREVLCNQLKQSRTLLNMQMYRIRLQLAESGILGVENLFERRPGQVRLGLTRVSEHALGA